MPLRSHGSLSLNRALMAAGLVDRVQVTLFPVISGQTGTDPIFQGAADFDLELIESRTSTSTSKSSPIGPPSTARPCAVGERASRRAPAVRGQTCDRSFVVVGSRSGRKAARISSEKSSGSSQAAKWPPLSTSLK